MDIKYFHFALEHAWKLHSVLPHKALTKTDGTVQCPLGVYTGQPVSVSQFRVLFCPTVFTYDNVHRKRTNNRTESIDPRREEGKMETLNRRNSSERGMRGIFVGLARQSRGFLIYSPATGKIYNTLDVYFDENFNSTLAHEPNKFTGYLDVTITDPMPDTDLPTFRTGNPYIFAQQHSPGFMRFAQANVKATML